MKRILTYFLTAVTFIAVSCSESFDDSEIWNKLNTLENRIAVLEQLCKQMNTNISSLQTIIEALQNKDYVTNVSPITEEGKVVGYTITFSKSGAITIYHGKDGKDGANGQDGKDGEDGYTPIIGIAKDTDGIYYWTLDGDWLLDNDGNKVKAEGVDGKDGADGKDGEDGKDGVDGTNGTNGADGKDGITPKLKIENGYWYISYDDGTTWSELGKATGEDGDSMFKDVTYDDEYVYITLLNGSKLVIPRHIIPMPSSNQIWYTNSSTTNVKLYYTDAFGANIISNQYDAEKKCWIITFDNKITSIGEGAFYSAFYQYCSNLISITIPESVTSIGASAFYGCNNLTNVTIPNSVTSIGAYAFNDCKSLTSITIPDNITSIEEGTFYHCKNLTSITIPKGVTSIGAGAFSGCNSLTNVTIPDSVTSIGAYAFDNCNSLIDITLPNSITSIEEATFYGCSSLANITIPDSVTSIGNQAFTDCKSLISFYSKSASEDNRCLIIDGELNSFAPAGLTSYNIPNGITSIGANAFWNCSNLTNITIPDNVTSIGANAFWNCSNLTSITIPDNVTSIGVNAFFCCNNLASFYGKFASDDNRCLIIDGELNSFAPAGLTSYTIPNNVNSIGEYAFMGCNKLTSIIIPNSVTTVEYSAFAYCSSLTSIAIPNSITTIEEDTFCGCSSLANINIPNSVSSIGAYAFNKCKSLTSITIPNNITTIGHNAFYGCTNLSSVYCKPTTPPKLGLNAFTDNSINLKIYVPTESVDTYKTSWRLYIEAIEGYNFE